MSSNDFVSIDENGACRPRLAPQCLHSQVYQYKKKSVSVLRRKWLGNRAGRPASLAQRNEITVQVCVQPNSFLERNPRFASPPPPPLFTAIKWLVFESKSHWSLRLHLNTCSRLPGFCLTLIFARRLRSWDRSASFAFKDEMSLESKRSLSALSLQWTGGSPTEWLSSDKATFGVLSGPSRR